MPVKIGVFTVLYQDLPLERALDRITALGVEAVEISTGNYAPATQARRGRQSSPQPARGSSGRSATARASSDGGRS
jgi:hypothetical protein